jgi:isoquinoline 1-oxidoreductase subunit alpha
VAPNLPALAQNSSNNPPTSLETDVFSSGSLAPRPPGLLADRDRDFLGRELSVTRPLYSNAKAVGIILERMAAIRFTLNGKPETADVVPAMPLLWVLRDTLGMTGTKYGCGMAVCGACTVHVNGQPMRACSTPVGSIAGKSVTTIEGLSADNSHPVQRAWIDADVPQCGYCQSGQIMTAVALLSKTNSPTDADIDEAMRNNICRCGTYQSIREAIHLAAQYAGGKK